MSDSHGHDGGDIANDRDAAIDQQFNALVSELRVSQQHNDRAIYDGLIRAARSVRQDRDLTEMV